MKKKLTGLLILFTIHTQAQSGFLAVGINLSYGSNTGLNQLVKYYNDTRTWLSDPMEDFHFTPGAALAFGAIVNDRFLMDFSWTGRHQTQKAGGVSPSTGTNGYREIKVRENTGGFDFGFGISEPAGVGIFLGASFDFGFTHTKTRTWSDGESIPKFTEVPDMKVMLASSIFLDIRSMQSGFSIRPYYQLHYFKVDYSYENEVINNASVMFEDPALASRPNNAGVLLCFVVGG